MLCRLWLLRVTAIASPVLKGAASAPTVTDPVRAGGEGAIDAAGETAVPVVALDPQPMSDVKTRSKQTMSNSPGRRNIRDLLSLQPSPPHRFRGACCPPYP